MEKDRPLQRIWSQTTNLGHFGEKVPKSTPDPGNKAACYASRNCKTPAKQCFVTLVTLVTGVTSKNRLRGRKVSLRCLMLRVPIPPLRTYPELSGAIQSY